MNIEHDHDAPLPDELRRSLRALRRDTAPERDLWAGISARISGIQGQVQSAAPAPMPSSRALPAQPLHAHRGRRSRRLVGLATAASLVAVLAIGWGVFRPSVDAPSPAATASTPMLREAAHMTREYRTAWRAFDARRPAGVDTSALHEIDRNAAQVRAALHQDPDARYLFERLQSLYALRLDLSRRLSALPTLST
jgi:hypothetical protein